MKKFKNKVRWEFQIAMHGYGRDVVEASLDAAERFCRSHGMDLQDSDFEAIEKHETISIDENDVEEDDDETKNGGSDDTE